MAFFHSPSVVSDGLVLYLDATNSKSYNSDLNLLSPKKYWTESSGSVTQFSQNGGTSENVRVFDTDPWGNTSLVWETRCDSVSGADGGWNSSYRSVDNTQLYRASVWMRRTSQSSAGNFYMGTNGGGSHVLNISNKAVNSNPYWLCPGTTQFQQNVWYLIVGHAFPRGHTGTARHPDTGIYTIAGGTARSQGGWGCNTGGDVVFAENTTSMRHRTYHYYSADNTVRLQFFQPRIEKVDGSEPSIQDLLDNNIPPENVTTWKDLSGNGKNGTLTNGVELNIRERDYLKFDGSNDYIDLGSDVVFKTTGGWTVETWVNYDSVAGAYDNTTSPANFIGADSIVYNSWYWSVLDSKLALWNRSPGVWKYGSTTLASGRWYHAVLVSYDSGTSYQMYLNGQREGGDHVDYSWNSAYAGLRVRYIGRGNSTYVRQLNGKIASTKIFTRALTDQEIQKNYNATKSRFGL